ncbi:MAG: NAD(P)/FAD-dependent oxidoreductase, partial [Oscillospiraceae bacterium]|nr:NAD(P)/FAD-dependent oxidoreductase [Oscillospiraceae bacterium]
MEHDYSKESNIRFPTVALVGGGASGMMAAPTAAKVPGRRVHLIERQQRV